MSDDSSVDPATGLLHRAAFLKEVREAQIKSATEKRRGCLLILHFPGLLDLGQEEGRGVAASTLKNLLAIIETRLRRRDTLGRIGENSLCVLLRQCQESDAVIIAEQYEGLLNDVAFDDKVQRSLVGFNFRIVSLDSSRHRAPNIEENGVNTRALSEASILLSTIRSFMQSDAPVSGEVVPFGDATSEQREVAQVTRKTEITADTPVDVQSNAEMSPQNWRLKPGHLLSQKLLVSCYRMQSVGFASSDHAVHESPMFETALNALALNLKLSRPTLESLLILPISAVQLTNEATYWLKERCRSQRIAPSDICLLLSVETISKDLRTFMPVLRRLNRQGIRLMLEGVGSAPQFTALQNLAGFDYLWISAKVLQASFNDVRKRQELESLVEAAHGQHREVCAAGIDTQALLSHAQALNIDIGFGRACGRSLAFPDVDYDNLTPIKPIK